MTSVLSDPAYGIGLPAGAPAWQARMARFTDGPAHAGRRAAVVALVERWAPDALAAAARARTGALLAGTAGAVADGMALARRVPVTVLAATLGVAEDRLDEVVDLTATLVAAAARGEPDDAGNAAAAVLGGLLADDGDAATATAALSVLFQTHDATAALVGNGLVAWGDRDVPDDPAALVDHVLRHDPPVLSTRRVAAGDPVVVDLAGPGLPFGAGPHACPGRDAAVALATGVLAGIAAAGWAPRGGADAYDPRPNLRLPTRVELVRVSPGGAPPRRR